jgi:hypothetical protein
MQLPGVPPASASQDRFLAAAAYSALLLQISQQLFQKPFFGLGQDERRIVDNETSNLLLQSRWKIESRGFADFFATLQVGGDPAPRGTVLGDPPAQQAQTPGHPGQYL